MKISFSPQHVNTLHAVEYMITFLITTSMLPYSISTNIRSSNLPFNIFLYILGLLPQINTCSLLATSDYFVNNYKHSLLHLNAHSLLSYTFHDSTFFESYSPTINILHIKLIAENMYSSILMLEFNKKIKSSKHSAQSTYIAILKTHSGSITSSK